MQRWLYNALFLASFTAMAVGQMAEPVAVDLERGLVNSQPVPDMKGQLFGKEELSLEDMTLSFRMDQKRDDAEHPTQVLRLPADDARLVVGVGGEDGIHVRRGDSAEIIAAVSVKPNLMGSHAVALVIKRDPRQALSSLWVDGVERLSFAIPPGAWRFEQGQAQFNPGGPGLAQMDVSNIRLYNRALSRPEIIALAEQSQPKPEQEVIAIIGGTEAVALAESGWLETYLNLSRVWTANDTQPIVRDLAWEGDTVFEQKRPLNFGSLRQQLERVQAKRTVVIVGRQECLDRGADGLSAFREALTKLVQQCPRGAVIVGAVPFEKKAAPLPDLAATNDMLARYDDAMRAVAEATGGTFIDTARSWRKQTETWTRDGLTLNDHGARTLGDIIAFHLGNTSADPPAADLAKLRKLAVQKHALWHRYWRPSNWAFLYGDRTAQPSSRDHLNPNVRWFPQELEQYRSLIEAKEDELWKLSQDLGRKLP